MSARSIRGITGWWFSWRELIAFGMAFGLSIAAAPYEMTRYYSMRDVTTVRYAIGISMAAQVLIGASVMMLGIGMRGIFPYPAVARSGVEHHGVDRDVAAARRAVPGGDALRHHVDGELDPARHRRRVRARPLQATDRPDRDSQRRLVLGQPHLDRRARRRAHSGSRRGGSATCRPS